MTTPAERRRAVAVAGHRGDAEVVRAGLADPDPVVRATALGAAHRCGIADAALVAAALDDPDAGVRRRAAELAPALDPVDGTPAVRLVGLLDDDDLTVVETAAFALGEQDPHDPDAVAALAAMATGHDDALCREAAVAALGSIGDEAGLAAVLAATTDKATVRRRAVIALAAFDGPEVDAALERARHDRDRQVRQAAEDLLAE
ncbi:MAG TPA: HEAT repeat domain-containing protein [Acidimicrobiales bacterium]|nr:HEAT repeat domain-containing protein [Acidimicrobiales bacterium]